MKKFLPFLLVSLLAACVTSKVTNLTSTKQPRNANNQYLVEYEWDTNQQTLRPDTITPYVVIGMETFPMRQTPKMTNRWETFISVPPGKKSVIYKFKIDYDYNRFGKPGKSSFTTSEYKLEIAD